MIARRWIAPALWAAVILTLTSLPDTALGLPELEHADKLVHATLYGILGWLSVRAVFPARHVGRAALLVLVGVSLFGAVDEWHQQFIAGRSMSLWDWCADTLGAAAGVVAALSLRRKLAA